MNGGEGGRGRGGRRAGEKERERLKVDHWVGRKLDGQIESQQRGCSSDRSRRHNNEKQERKQGGCRDALPALLHISPPAFFFNLRLKNRKGESEERGEETHLQTREMGERLGAGGVGEVGWMEGLWLKIACRGGGGVSDKNRRREQ